MTSNVFRITVEVEYDPTSISVPLDMAEELRDSFAMACDSSALLSDNDDTVEVNNWKVKVTSL